MAAAVVAISQVRSSNDPNGSKQCGPAQCFEATSVLMAKPAGGSSARRCAAELPPVQQVNA